ncbi:prepilin-type N-terminal cleavage/methylation domain-containing protein [Candidatus Gottesmanbacteria bacterium]|nr:prepilin-type N-terminal cleavage/methylation domain-containing protein [Candidatus Gottesmanbacteria bacterium]
MKYQKSNIFSRGFTLMELLIVIALLGILIVVGLGSFQSATRKSKDSQRKANLKSVSVALEAYFNDAGAYPADDGQGHMVITDCSSSYSYCPWGSPMKNTATTYMALLPSDPGANAYWYIAGTSNASYQMYARIDNLEDGAITVSSGKPQMYSDVTCGSKKCNYGVSSSNILPETGRTLADDPG